MVTVKFNGHKAVPRKLRVGVETDNLVEKVTFQLPEIGENQRGYVYASDGDGHYDVIALENGVWDVGMNTTQASGKLAAFVRVVSGNRRWNSEPFYLQITDLPDIESDIEQAYPSAIQTALDALAGALEEVEAAEGRVEDTEARIAGAITEAEEYMDAAVAGVQGSLDDIADAKRQISALHTQEFVLEQDVAELKSAIDNLDKEYASTLSFELTSDEYVDRGTGAFKAYGGWSRTGYIDLTGVVNFTANTLSNYSAFYGADKTYVKGVTFSAGQKIDVPENVAYLAVSNATSDMNSLRIACTRLGVVKTMQNAVDDLNEFINNNTYIYPEDIITDAFINTNGTLTSNASGYLATPYIPLPFNETQNIQIRCVVYGNASCAIYDKNYNLLLAISGSNAEQYGGSASGGFSVLSIPYIEGMRYARMSARSIVYTALTDLWAKGNTIAGAFKRIASIETDLHSMEGNISTTIANSKVLVIGDSISTDVYGNYKKWVTDLKESGFLPADVVNNSQHATGFVARYNNQENDFITRLKAVQNPSQYDLVIVFGGINDYIQNIPMGSDSGTDYTVSFKPAVNEFFSYLIQNFTQARLCVLLPLRTYATWQNTAGEYQQAYGEYIKTVAKSYCLPVLNLTEDSGFCPYIPIFRDMWTLVPEGFDSSDGVHPNAEYERRFLAPMIRHFLQGLM